MKSPKPATKRPKPAHHNSRLSKRKRRSRLHVLKFLPAIVLLSLAAVIGLQPHHAIEQPHSGVLSYATSVSISDLLSGTNAQRSSNGIASLSLNSKLNSAAQTKANDMVARNYWSHVTPEGNEPWTFITGAGYQYTTAGENLAYGFITSSDTITGWMNSAPHKANILNGSFTEVGFGIANSANFNNDGQQTVVVAMYASPQAAPAAAVNRTAPTTTPTSNPAPPPSTIRTDAPDVAAAEPVPDSTPVETTTTTTATDVKKPLVAATASVKTTPVHRIQILTGGKASWSATAIVACACGLGMMYAIQRGFRIKKLLLTSEHFIAQHLYLDITVAALILLSISMVVTVGNIR